MVAATQHFQSYNFYLNNGKIELVPCFIKYKIKLNKLIIKTKNKHPLFYWFFAGTQLTDTFLFQFLPSFQ